MRSSLVVAALFGISRAMPAKLAARNPDPVWVTTTVYIDVWNTVTDDFGAWPTGGVNQNNGKLASPPRLSLTHAADPDCDTPAAPAPAAQTQQAAAAAPQPAPAPAPAAETPAAQPAAPTSGSYSDTVVSSHNVHRSNHSAPAMVWDQGLADTALTIAQSCQYAHNV
jgi:hypothetical protein